MTDGNTYAINKHLSEREAYDAMHPADLYCPACDETIKPLDWPVFINDKEATCPDCGGELEET
jgi:uncharacterized paraquat-inducible protein A